MTTFCPFARLELVDDHSSTSIIGRSIGLVLHVNAGDGDPYSTFALGLADSHWQVMKTGELIQYVDSDLDSWAQIAGNQSYHSVETEGYPNEPLTAAQFDTLVKLYEWGHIRYGWPLAVAEAPGQPGFGWHGMGGTAWGGHFGCPGDLRKAARQLILDAVTAGTGLTPPAAPLAVPASEADMPLALQATDPITGQPWTIRVADGDIYCAPAVPGCPAPPDLGAPGRHGGTPWGVNLTVEPIVGFGPCLQGGEWGYQVTFLSTPDSTGNPYRVYRFPRSGANRGTVKF